MAEPPIFPLTVFYDGSCVVCSREMERYRHKAHGGRLEFVDISAPDFEPLRYGRGREEFMRQLHVYDAKGRLFLGVDAFPAIWQALPGSGYRILGGLIRLPGIHPLAILGYKVFAGLRRYLPKRGGACSGDTCRPIHRH